MLAWSVCLDSGCYITLRESYVSETKLGRRIVSTLCPTVSSLLSYLGFLCCFLVLDSEKDLCKRRLYVLVGSNFGCCECAIASFEFCCSQGASMLFFLDLENTTAQNAVGISSLYCVFMIPLEQLGLHLTVLIVVYRSSARK